MVRDPQREWFASFKEIIQQSLSIITLVGHIHEVLTIFQAQHRVFSVHQLT